MDDYFKKIRDKYKIDRPHNKLNEIYHYISTDLIIHYELGNLLFNLFQYLKQKHNPKLSFKDIDVLEFCYFINYIFQFIDIVFSLKCFFNHTLNIHNKVNIHVLYGDSLAELGIMYVSNIIGKHILSILEKIDTKQNYQRGIQIVRKSLNIIHNNTNTDIFENNDSVLFETVINHKKNMIETVLIYIYYLFDLDETTYAHEIEHLKLKICGKLKL